MMQLSLPKDELKEYVGRQLEVYFPDKYHFVGDDIDSAFDLALERTENCFRYINNAAYSDNNGTAFFYHLHSDQYAQFLYYLSNTLWSRSENKPVCDKLIYLNKVLHGFWFSYKGKLPDIFFLSHPVGTVLGNADYSNYMFVSQNVTVNTGDCPLLPKLGKGLFLAPGAKIIGSETIGDRVSIGVDAVIYNQEVGDDRVVERTPEGNILIRERRKKCCKAQRYFNIDIG
jgi:serine O-acetyltransferase